MAMRYKGGVISATPPTTSSTTATGIWTLPQQLQAVAASNWPEVLPAPGQQAYTTAGTYTWVAPAGVTNISIVAVGAGGSANGGRNTSSGAWNPGGEGGNLRYVNGLSVTPGNSYTVVVGAANQDWTAASGSSSFATGATKNLLARGGATWGSGPVLYTNTDTEVGTLGGVGGTYGNNYGQSGLGGAGGGGAGGYSGNGGKGGDGDTSGSSTAGSGGGGGGGGSSAFGFTQGAGGGGVGILGQGSNGGAGSSPGSGGGGGGSGGSDGQGGANNDAGDGGAYGGAGGGSGGIGAVGAVRIIWPGQTRSFPSTNTGNL